MNSENAEIIGYFDVSNIWNARKCACLCSLNNVSLGIGHETAEITRKPFSMISTNIIKNILIKNYYLIYIIMFIIYINKYILYLIYIIKNIIIAIYNFSCTKSKRCYSSRNQEIRNY